MPVNWRPSTSEAHETLPKKHQTRKDAGWEAVLDELAQGNTVMIEYADQQERNTLARSLGRRASSRGFHVDLRDGDGYVSVRKGEEAEPTKPRKARRARAGA